MKLFKNSPCSKQRKKKINVFSLAPTVHEKQSDYHTYKRFLNTALRDKSIRNIAITGNFGIGKSSFLNWYAKGRKYLFVSLCEFTSGEGKKNIDELGGEVCRQLHVGCLKSQNIGKIACRLVAFLASLFLCLIVAYYLLINNCFHSADALYDIIKHLWKIDTQTFTDEKLLEALKSIKPIVDSLSGIIALVVIPFVNQWIVSKIAVAKLSIKTAEVEAELELEKNKDIRIIDLNKIDLINSLRRAAHRFQYTIIFEDFDRMNYEECRFLFTSLRELNRLVKNIIEKFGKNQFDSFMLFRMIFLYVYQKKLKRLTAQLQMNQTMKAQEI